MTCHTIDICQPPARATSGSGAIDVRRLGPMALAMRFRAARRGPYVAPSESEYFAY
jgi:hypothetical protein